MEHGIPAATLVGRTAGSTLLCSICREPDHTARQCALSYLQPPTGTSNAPGPSVWPPGPRGPLRRQLESMTNICMSWNKGHCTFLGMCQFRHACATCQQPETVQQPLLTRSTNVGVVAGTQPCVPARDSSFDVAGYWSLS